MHSHESGLLPFFKSVLYKGFFAFGVVSACGYAHSHFFSPSLPASSSLLDQKVVELVKNPEFKRDLEQVVETEQHEINPVLPVAKSSAELPTVPSPEAAAPAVLADATAAASPADPGVDGTPAPSPAEGELDASNVLQVQFNNPNPPYAYSQDAQVDSSADRNKDDSKNPSNLNSNGSVPFIGFIPPLQNNHGTTNAANGFSNGSPGSSVEQSSFVSSDVAILTASMRGLFTDKTESISGTLCPDGQAGAANCTKEPHYQIHTSRWNQTSGLSSDVGFSVTGTSSADLQVHITLKIQSGAQAAQSFTGLAAVTGVSVVNENRSGRKYRIFTLNFSEMTLGSDKLSSGVATLMYDTTAGGASIASDSILTFNRKNVQTLPIAWDAANSTRTPAGNDPLIIADQIQYSIAIEK